MSIIRHSQVISWCLIVGSRSKGVKRKSAQAAIFLFFKSACNGLFVLPEGKKMWKEIEIVSAEFWGVFPLKGKYLEEPLWMTHYSRLSAPMSFHLSFAWECSLNGVYAFKEIQKGEWTNVNSFCYKIQQSATNRIQQRARHSLRADEIKLWSEFSNRLHAGYWGRNILLKGLIKQTLWTISISGIEKSAHKEPNTIVNIVVISLASKCIKHLHFNRQQLKFDWNK